MDVESDEEIGGAVAAVPSSAAIAVHSFQAMM